MPNIGPQKPKDTPADNTSLRYQLRDRLERQAATSLEHALRLEELAARARTDAARLGRLSVQFGGLPPLVALPGALDEPQDDQAA